MKLRQAVFAAGLTAGGLIAGLGLRTVLADGIPAPNPLYYAGTLTENGTPVNGTRDITMNIWSAQTGGTMLCQTLATGAMPAEISNGRFRIALDPSCKTAINKNNNAWIEILDGTTSLGRTPIGAVPYAVEADHAVSATSAVSVATGSTGSIGAGLAVFSPSGVATPCAISTLGSPVVDCSCPAGTFVVNGGGEIAKTGAYIRESRPITTSMWRVTCASPAGDTTCDAYNLTCSRLGP